MKVNVVPKKEKSIEYPFIGVTEQGLTVLFSEYGNGIVLNGDDIAEFGYHATNWDMKRFTPFQGTIELSND